MLDRSPLIINLLQGTTQDMNFVLHGNTYPKYYLFADVIYLQWSIFVQTIHEPQGEKRQHFSKMQGAKKMWSLVLGCFKCNLQSYKIQVDNGTRP